MRSLPVLQQQTERWIAYVRAVAVFFAVLQVALATGWPSGYERLAWITTAFFAIGSAILVYLVRADLRPRRQLALSLAALTFDFAVASAYMLVYSFEVASPIRQVLYLVAIEGAVRFGIVGGLLVTAASIPVLVEYEQLRADRVGGDFRVDYVTLQVGAQAIVAVIVGALVFRLARESAVSDARAVEAEELRDELGRRVDVLEGANRCARALASSLDLGSAFEAFIREVRGFVPFDRIAVVMRDGDRLEVLAAAGVGVDEVFPPGSSAPTGGSIFERLAGGQVVYRRDMRDREHEEEAELVRLGLHSRLTTPLMSGTTVLGLISFSRRDVDAFTPEEVEFVALIGRLAAT